MLASGCSLVPDVKHKPQLINPFPQLKTLAVLPFSNQSEEPTLSGERVSLAYLNELQSIRGFEVLPIGVVRVKLDEYLRSGRSLNRGEDFQAFAQFLDVDAVIVGAITDYDAYYPPRMGLKVSWYAANPGFHPVLPGYGLPWGTKAEEDLPRWVHQEAQRALAAEQLQTQVPMMQSASKSMPLPIMPEDRGESLPLDGPRSMTPSSKHMRSQGELLPTPTPVQGASATQPTTIGGDMTRNEIVVLEGDDWSQEASPLPPNWPDSRGFIPDPPAAERPQYLAQAEPIISHMRNFNGHDEDFTEQLAEYFYYRDDARFGGWQAYLQRSEDFIRFCCHLHLSETLTLRGGQDESRLILRWPIGRYTR